MKLTGMYFGSYWMGENDVVRLMAEELKDLVNLKVIDTKIYSGNAGNWYKETLGNGRRFAVRWLNESKLKKVVEKYKPNFIIINSGGMTITQKSSDWLREKGVVTVGIELSDPDVFDDNGGIYSKYFDLFYTNSKLSLSDKYVNRDNVKWLPFAASTKLHKPMPKIEKVNDVVIIGHARKDRLELVRKLRNHYKVATFGLGWGDDSKEVHGIEHVKAINSGKIYLSFAMTYDGYTNVKVGLMEAAACKVCVITSRFKELDNLFTYGIDISGYDNDESLIKTIDYYLNNDIARQWLASNSYNRTVNNHTWTHRWKEVLNDIENAKKRI